VSLSTHTAQASHCRSICCRILITHHIGK